jgi:hypothetical protein
MRTLLAIGCLSALGCAAPPPALQAGPKPESTARTAIRIDLAPPAAPAELRPDSPFGINTALRPDAPDAEARVRAMQQAGIKWGRQDFGWSRIEKEQGVYDWEPYERHVELFRRHGILLFGNFTGHPAFHDPRTPEGVEAYARFAAEGARRFAGKVDHWQIWNEPNGGYWKGTPEQYAALLAAAGKAIHAAAPKAKVLALNMAFCDHLWAERIFKLVPWDAFDVVCFHPYRAFNAPEEKFDWWLLDYYIKANWHKAGLKPDYAPVRMSFLEQTDALIELMRKFGEPKPLWVTEMCFNTDLHPYGVSELRSADLTVRFYLNAIASRKIEKVFWWTLRDGGNLQFDKAQMVGLMRADLEPKYAYYAYAELTRRLEGKSWVRNDAWGPDAYAAVFTDGVEDTVVLWATQSTRYARINVDEKGVTVRDVYGTSRFVAYDARRTKHNPFPFGESPIYVTGPKGLKVSVRPDPGW